MTLPLIVAHRGNKSVTPENTLPAFASAIRSGCDGIETDVVMTADNTPVVIHDKTVDKTTDGSGHVGQMTLTQIRQLDAGSWFSPGFAGTHIPTFTEFAQLMTEAPGIEILLEFKGHWTAEQASVVFEDVKTHELTDRTMLQSFHPLTIGALHEIAPGSKRGALLEILSDELIASAQALGLYTVNPDVNLVLNDPSLVQLIHDADMKIQVWTANTTEQWERLVELGVDAIITDRPDALNGWYAGRGLL